MRNQRAGERTVTAKTARRRDRMNADGSRSVRFPALLPISPVARGDALTTHESVYRRLRDGILCGGFHPGSAITLRGLAEDLGVSPTPVREAVRRLIAERALKMQDNRRVLVPPMTREVFEQIVFARKTLEPELAVRAMDHIGPAEIRRIQACDKAVGRAVAAGDARSYMESNYRFHFSIYRHASADTLLALVESVWLQFGPFMRMAYDRSRRFDLADQHQAAIAALKRRDRKGLRAAIAADACQGMTLIGEAVARGRGPAIEPRIGRQAGGRPAKAEAS